MISVNRKFGACPHGRFPFASFCKTTESCRVGKGRHSRKSKTINSSSKKPCLEVSSGGKLSYIRNGREAKKTKSG